jgi:stage V sporulation protein B
VTKQSFIKGTMILLAAGMINRVLGFVPRITLPRVIGPEGVGLYQMGYPFLIVILTFITGGIPIAVAKLVAEAEAEGNETRVRKIFRTALALSVLLGVIFTTLSYVCAEWITSHLLTDPRVFYTFLCMTPIILIVSVSAAFRGYFQGRQNMIPTALSQVVETLVRSVMALVFAFWMLPYGIEYAAAGAMVGVLVGEVCAMLVLFFQYRSERKHLPTRPTVTIGTSKTRGRFRGLRQLLRLAVPVTGSKLVGSTSYLLESILTVQSLAAAGIVTALATAQYGALQGMVIPVLLLPSALTYSLSVSLVPSLSEAKARNDMKTIHMRLQQSLKLALVTGAPFAVIMYVLAEPLCLYMYGQPQVGTMLKIMAPAALFIYFQAPLQAALQALERPGSALINTFIGSSAKLTLIWLLASRPEFGILGAVIAINVNIMLVTILHWNSIVRLLKFQMNHMDFAKVGLAMAATGALCYTVTYTEWVSNAFIRFSAACISGVGLYIAISLLLKLFDKDDLLKITRLSKRIVK